MANLGQFKQAGAMINVKASKEIGYHELIVVGEIVAVARHSASKGEIISCDTEGVFALPKKKSEKLKQGAKVYANEAGITATAGSDKAAGIVWAEAVESDETVLVKINA